MWQLLEQKFFIREGWVIIYIIYMSDIPHRQNTQELGQCWEQRIPDSAPVFKIGLRTKGNFQFYVHSV